MAKIIEASAVISARAGDMSGLAKLSAGLLNASKTASTVSGAIGKNGVELSKRVDEISKKLGSIEGFRNLSRGLDAASLAMRKAQQDAARLKAALDATASPSRAMQGEYARAVGQVERLSAAFRQQGQAVRDARNALERGGMPIKNLSAQQEQLTRSLDATTRAMQRQAQAARSAPMRGVTHPTQSVPLHGTIAAGPGAETSTSVMPIIGRMAGPAALGYVGYKALSGAHGAVLDQHSDYQQAYLYQQGVLGYDKATQAPLIAQSEKIGKDTKFSNADIVRAQTDIGSKLPKEMQTPGAIMAITENTKNYALAMKVSMEEGAEAVVGYMKSWGYDLSSPEAAASSSKRASNMLVQFAKTTGAKHHDILGQTKFGAAPSRAAGFDEELTNAVAAQLLRVGYEGSMAGTFARAVGSKLATPNRQGSLAMAGMGIEFGSYQKPGTEASAENLSSMLKLRFGRSLDDEQKKAVQEILSDKDVMADKDTYQEKMTDVLGQTFAKRTKGGKVNANDALQIAKVTDQFYNVSSSGVNTPRLFMDILAKGLTPALAKYLFGQEHGGRAIGLDPNAIRRDEADYKAVPQDRASTMADKMQEGAQGEWNKLIGAAQTFWVAAGERTDAGRASAYKGLAGMLDYATSMVKGTNVDPNVARNVDITPAGAPYRTDTWNTDAVGMLERSRREQATLRKGEAMEERRGLGMMELSRRLEVVPPGEQKVTLEGSAQVGVSVTVSPSPDFLTKVDQRVQSAIGHLSVSGAGPGSTGTSMPEAAAPNVGSSNPMGPR